MLILDTDCLTIVQRAEGEPYQRLAARLDAVIATRSVHVTVISLEEQMRGWLAYLAGQRTSRQQVDGYSRLLSLLQDFSSRSVLPFGDDAARQMDHLRGQRVRIGTMDMKIAAIAMARGATLISRNLRDFSRVPGLLVEDWTALRE